MANKNKVEVNVTAPELFEIDETVVKLPLGRPVNPKSKRQLQLAEYERKKAEGLLHRGRPTDPESPSHVAKAEREKRRQEKGELRRGRPVDPSSPRQQRLSKREVRIRTLIASAQSKVINGQMTVDQMNQLLNQRKA